MVKGLGGDASSRKIAPGPATAIDTTDWVVLIENPLVEFVGYELLETQTCISKYRKIKAGKAGNPGRLCLRRHLSMPKVAARWAIPVYCLSKGREHPGLDTKKENDLIIQFTDELPSDPSAPVIAKVDEAKRKRTEVHHTATHLLHAALRKTLGDHVAQKGSLVTDEQLRFDFSHFARMTEEEIAAVEALVNEKIRENIPVVIQEMPKDEAVKLGAMALFGEKYGESSASSSSTRLIPSNYVAVHMSARPESSGSSKSGMRPLSLPVSAASKPFQELRRSSTSVGSWQSSGLPGSC